MTEIEQYTRPEVLGCVFLKPSENDKVLNATPIITQWRINGIFIYALGSPRFKFNGIVDKMHGREIYNRYIKQRNRISRLDKTRWEEEKKKAEEFMEKGMEDVEGAPEYYEYFLQRTLAKTYALNLLDAEIRY